MSGYVRTGVWFGKIVALACDGRCGLLDQAAKNRRDRDIETDRGKKQGDIASWLWAQDTEDCMNEKPRWSLFTEICPNCGTEYRICELQSIRCPCGWAVLWDEDAGGHLWPEWFGPDD